MRHDRTGSTLEDRTAIDHSLRVWLGDDIDRVLFVVTHWRAQDFTGRTFHLAPEGQGHTPGESAS